MDIFSHGLWAGVAAKAINNKLEKKGNQLRLNVWLAGFWGVFPDIFASAVPFVWLGLSVFLGISHPSRIEAISKREIS